MSDRTSTAAGTRPKTRRSGGARAPASNAVVTAGANRKAATQEKILRAAMELFARRGYERASISQIAERSGVSRASIFWHFSDKATLFRETCRHFLVPFHRSLERSGDNADPRERVLEQIDAYQSFVEGQIGTLRSFISWVFTAGPVAHPLLEELMALHQAFQRRLEGDLGEILGDPDEASRCAATLISLLHGNLILSLGHAPTTERSPRADLARALVDRLIPDEQT